MKQNPSNESQSKKLEQSSKLPYKTPKVITYGSISKLTGRKASGKVKDGSGSKKS